MHSNCVGIKVVLADGTIVDQMNPHEKLPVGYDLKQLFIGAEGTLVSINHDVPFIYLSIYEYIITNEFQFLI